MRSPSPSTQGRSSTKISGTTSTKPNQAHQKGQNKGTTIRYYDNDNLSMGTSMQYKYTRSSNGVKLLSTAAVVVAAAKGLDRMN